MKRFLTFLASTAAALLCMPLGLLAQQVDTNPVELPSTSVWQQMKFSSMPGASLYTGTMHLSIPVYTYHDADFDIPLSLDYSTNGYRPNIMTGLVGHEWSLGLGGAITRTVRGLPDELRSAGLLGFQELHNRHDITSVDQIDIYHTQFDDEGIEATSPHLYYAPDGWDAGGDSIDMEPDIFQFSFLGHTGKFQLGYDGTINVYGTNTRSSEYKVQVNTYDLDTITITDGDGIRYIFGNADGKAREQAGGRTTTWKLSRIETPSGRYVDFTYTRSPRSDSGTLSYSMFNSYAPDTHCYSFFGSYYDEMGILRNINYDFKPVRPTLSSVMTVSAPDKVTVDNGTEIVFYYKNPSQLETGDGVTLLNLPKLDRIEVRAPGGTTVRSCTLGYSYPLASASNKLCFLSSVNISGEGSYTFDYNVNASTVFPKHGTFKIDHWGYYNNSSASAQTFYTHTLQGDYLEETINTNLREPSTAAALLGVMTAVHYPTKGYTTFEYEGNDYSRYEDNDGYPSFAPAMESTPSRASRTTGGVRIKAIRDYDRENAATPVYTRSYSYLDAEGHSSGVRGPLPRYGLEYQKYRIDGSNIDVYLGSYNNLAPADGTHIEYRRVTETLPQGSNVYEYITRDDCPDGKETWDNSNLYNLTFHTGFSPDIYMPDEEAIDAIFSVMTPTTSMQASRGQLLSTRTYDAQGNLKQSSETTYEPYAYAFETIDKIWNYQSMYLGATRVPTVTGDIKPLSTTTVSDGVSDTEVIVYDTFRNVRSRTHGRQTSKYFYFEDLPNRASYSDFRDISYWDTFAGSAVCARMAALNMKNSPLQTEAYDEDGILHVLRYEYETRATAGGSAVFLKSIKEHDGSVWRTVMSIDARDSRGRILETSDADGIKTAYVWGYGGLYPVAEVNGATLMEVKGISGLSGIETAPLAGALTGNQAAALRNLGDATVWEYSPLVGVTRETAPDGRSVSNTYNDSGKLYQVLDDLGHKTSAYLYSTDNKLQISDNH